jgi:polysaccharide export outer membrane protein
MAGGFTEWAQKKEIILLRKENGEDKVYRINYRNIMKGKDYSSNILLKADDTIIVP